jgi:hypothetical protein
MTTYVFVGPTLPSDQVRAMGDFVCLPPVAQGDVYRATQAGARAIGLIDGYFEGVPAVWHKEVLWALSRGVHVFGSASMGALRGAELEAFGMRGVGRIFEAYRDGVLEDDDEVAVLHGPAEIGYVALSVPMVNVRATVDRAVAEQIITADSGEVLTTGAKSMFYQARDWDAVAADRPTVSPSECAAFRAWLPGGQVDLKADDATAMLTAMAEWLAGDPPAFEATFDFEWTDAWDMAIAVTPASAPHAGTALAPQLVLDELRLDPAAFRTAKTAALARLLALRAADRRASATGRRAASAALDRFRTSHGLFRRADLDRWLGRNDLGAEDFERLMEDQARLDAYAAAIDHTLEGPLLAQLRLDDHYAALAARAARKHAELEAGGWAEAEPADCGLAPSQLVLWYFEARLGQAAPDDLDDAARRLGLAGRSALYRLLAREYLFSSRNGDGQADG